MDFREILRLVMMAIIETMMAVLRYAKSKIIIYVLGMVRASAFFIKILLILSTNMSRKLKDKTEQ